MTPKIGILTFHNGPNYGAFMQAWHLRTAIRSMGFDAQTINYLHTAHMVSNLKSVKVKDLNSLKIRIHWLMKRFPFRNIEKMLCEDPFTSNPDKVPWENYHTIVVGSDVVWDFQNPDFGHDPAYFGMLPSQKACHMVSYAASCGPAVISGDLPEFCDGLNRFHGLSVRDAASMRLVKQVTGKTAELVVDPTWLQEDPQVSWARAPKEKYVLVYGTAMRKDFAQALRQYCDKKGLKIISAAAGCAIADKTYRVLAPFQWVDLIRNASGCVIGGLHGTLYSIKYGKPFLLINNARTRQKAQEALSGSGQEFRGILPEDVKPEHIELVDPASGKPGGVPEPWRASSWEFLKSSFSGIDS
jgi:hypothetical protein